MLKSQFFLDEDWIIPCPRVVIRGKKHRSFLVAVVVTGRQLIITPFTKESILAYHKSFTG